MIFDNVWFGLSDLVVFHPYLLLGKKGVLVSKNGVVRIPGAGGWREHKEHSKSTLTIIKMLSIRKGFASENRLNDCSFEEHFGNGFKPFHLDAFLLTCNPFWTFRTIG